MRLFVEVGFYFLLFFKIIFNRWDFIIFIYVCLKLCCGVLCDIGFLNHFLSCSYLCCCCCSVVLLRSRKAIFWQRCRGTTALQSFSALGRRKTRPATTIALYRTERKRKRRSYARESEVIWTGLATIQPCLLFCGRVYKRICIVHAYNEPTYIPFKVAVEGALV